MAHTNISNYSIYRTVINQVMEGTENLPSLPSLTLKIRRAIHDPNATAPKLAALIEQDPALCAMLMKYVSSPMYRTRQQPTTLEGVISILGMGTVDNVIMLHSVKSLFIMDKPQLKSLYTLAWKRLITKAATSTVVAEILKFHPADQIMISSLLTEIGTLAVLSALKDSEYIPDEETYFELCRQYSKSLGVILLKKWAVDESYVDILKQIGEWNKTPEPDLNAIDVINLGLYQAVVYLSPAANLPPITDLVAYRKLSEEYNEVDGYQRLKVLLDKQERLETVISSLK